MPRKKQPQWYVTKAPSNSEYQLYDSANTAEQAKSMLKDLADGSPIAQKSRSHGANYNIYVKKESVLWRKYGGKAGGGKLNAAHAKEIKYTSKQDHEQRYKGKRKSAVVSYKNKGGSMAGGGEIIDTFTSIQGSKVMPNNPFTIEKENEFYVIKNSKGEVLAKDTTKDGIMNDKGMFLNLYAKGGSMASGGEIKAFEKELKSNGFDFERYPNPNGYLLLVDDLKERTPYEIEETINSISSKLGVSDQVLLPQVTRSIGFTIVYDTDKSYAKGGSMASGGEVKRGEMEEWFYEHDNEWQNDLEIDHQQEDTDLDLIEWAYYRYHKKGGSMARGGEIETKREFVEVVNQVKEENEAFPNDSVNVMDSINAILQDRGYEEDDEYTYDVRQEILDRYEKQVLDKQGLRFAKGGSMASGGEIKNTFAVEKDGKYYDYYDEKWYDYYDEQSLFDEDWAKELAESKGGNVINTDTFAKGGSTYAGGGEIIQEISTHKAVRNGDKIDIVSKGFEIGDLKYNDEVLYSIRAENEEDLMSIFDNLQEENRILLAQANGEFSKGGSTYAKGGNIIEIQNRTGSIWDNDYRDDIDQEDMSRIEFNSNYELATIDAIKELVNEGKLPLTYTISDYKSEKRGSTYAEGGAIGGGKLTDEIRVRFIEDDEINIWTIEEALDRINEDGYASEDNDLAYDISDWLEGWNEALEGEFYSLNDKNGKPLNEKFKLPTYAGGGSVITEEWHSLGGWNFQAKNDKWNVQFNDDTMTIRNDNQSVIEVLKRDRSFNGRSDEDIVMEFLNSQPTYAEGGEIPNKIKVAIKKYGEAKCLEAFKLHEEGMGGNSVGLELGVTTNTADSMIDCGRYLTENSTYALGGVLTKAELKLNIYEPSGDYYMEKKGGKIILHLTSKDASNLPPSFFERYNVEDNGKGYYGTSYIVSKKTTYAEGGEIKVGDKVTLSEIKMPNGDIQFERVENGTVKAIDSHGIYDVHNHKTNRIHRVSKDQIESKGGSTYAEGGKIDSYNVSTKMMAYDVLDEARKKNLISDSESSTLQKKSFHGSTEEVEEARKELVELLEKFHPKTKQRIVKNYSKGGSTYAGGGEVYDDLLETLYELQAEKSQSTDSDERGDLTHQINEVYKKLSKYPQFWDKKEKGGSTYAEGGSIPSQTVEFEYKGEAYKFDFTPEEEDWWTAFPSKIKGVEFDVHYYDEDDDYSDISVYEVINGKNTDKTVYHKQLKGSTYAEGGEMENEFYNNPELIEEWGDGKVDFENWRDEKYPPTYKFHNEILALKRSGRKNIILNGFSESVLYVLDKKLNDYEIGKQEDGNYVTLYTKGGSTYAEGGGVGLSSIKGTREHLKISTKEWQALSEEEKTAQRRLTYKDEMRGKSYRKKEAIKSRGMSKVETNEWFTGALSFLNW